MANENTLNAAYHLYDKNANYQESFEDIGAAKDQAELLKGFVMFGGTEFFDAQSSKMTHINAQMVQDYRSTDDPLEPLRHLSEDKLKEVAKALEIPQETLDALKQERAAPQPAAPEQPTPPAVEAPKAQPKATPARTTYDPRVDAALAALEKLKKSEMTLDHNITAAILTGLAQRADFLEYQAAYLAIAVGLGVDLWDMMADPDKYAEKVKKSGQVVRTTTSGKQVVMKDGKWVPPKRIRTKIGDRTVYVDPNSEQGQQALADDN